MDAAIPYQVPVTTADALVLNHHIIEGLDLVLNATSRLEPENEAVTIAVATLFDFLTSEDLHTDHEALGKSFKSSVMRVYSARRFRTGEVEA